VIGVGSHTPIKWFASFALTTDGPFLRFADPWSAVASQALYAGGTGGCGFLQYAPTSVVRIETSAAATATTSFVIVEVAPR
jgi:hypothetical protein